MGWCQCHDPHLQHDERYKEVHRVTEGKTGWVTYKYTLSKEEAKDLHYICPHCDGEGIVPVLRENEQECPVCGGTGEI